MSFATRVRNGMAKWGERSALGAARFPIAVLAIAGFSIVSNLVTAGWDTGGVETARLLAALSCAGAVSVAATLLLEAHSFRPLVRHSVSLVLAVAAGAAVHLSQPFAVNGTMLLAAAILAVPLAPFVGRGTSGEFWTFSFWTALGVGLAFVTVVLFCLGMQAVIEMVRYLFDLGGSRRFEGHLLTTALTFVGPLFALGRIPDPAEPLEVPGDRDRLTLAVRALLEWVQLPLVLVAAVVLHAYAARIGITGVVPRNQAGWIVGVYSLLLLQLRLSLDPFREWGSAPSRWFLRHWAWLLVVPLALLAYALWQRIDAEGFTLPRYVLGLWTVLVGLAVALQIPPRLRGDIRPVAALPVILLALATAGPWGVSATVGRSQEARILARYGGAADPQRPITTAEAEWLASRLRALDEVGELDRVRPLVAASIPDAGIGPDADLAAIVATLHERAFAGPRARNFVANVTGPITVSGYDLAFASMDVSKHEGVVRIASGTFVSLNWNGQGDRVDLAEIIEALPLGGSETSVQSLPPAPRFDLRSEGGRQVGLRVERLTLTEDGAVRDAVLTLLLRSADWPS